MNKKEKNRLTNLYNIYRNYLFAIREREEFGNKYGDTDELIMMYEKKLQEHGIKALTKTKLKR